ncbi:hypothetical protein CA54_25530 [Symmachiella macrocystis]|uniref:DegT/DnrJ/EryC1/StrS aminotransferase family protein n=1 Tax=Symmachiella macrocystis TaxID=2527985 RepID=A0A5C6BNV0_9PLAN|nr:hypothetical protein [Symmachiella macrocystis]TWU13718.1 hypothetical protein CA54_25530 [Symmachiella macrocystis]
MNVVGGYFEWEPTASGEPLHPHARLALNSGRSCVGCLLNVEKPAAVWVPFYCCDALLEPFRAADIPLKHYGLEPDLSVSPGVELGRGERIVVINYFGLQNKQIAALADRWAECLWVDNTQAFFHTPEAPKAFYFNSARKFFGVPDGGYLYSPDDAALPSPETWQRNANYRFEHLILREQGEIFAGHEIFRENERRNGEAITQISRLSESILGGVDYAQAARIRRENYQYLHGELDSRNRLQESLLHLDAEAVPFCYPFLPQPPILHQQLWDQQIFAPQLWAECVSRDGRGFDWERELSRELLSLPIDQRLGRAEMDRILEVLDAVA